MKRIVFVHPDLGIGGAERLVVDAALALKRKGHSVQFITAHHDQSHCFPETINGELEVKAVGDWLPRSTFGKFCAFWAYVRMIYVAFYLVYFSKIEYDIAFVDQISACIPVLRRKENTKIIFYCHYPDQLLTKRKTPLKRIYRHFIDIIEMETTKRADIVLVNSLFTATVFKETFPSISMKPDVLYPTLNLEKFDGETNSLLDFAEKCTFLSLNRYERKKDVMLAIEAFQKLLNKTDSLVHQKLHLVIAGGYDNRVVENIEYYKELREHCRKYDILKYVTFFKSPNDELKINLLKSATCILYTPVYEHFGIVPLEAMYCKTPVIAVNSGGPLETVVDGKTGFLREASPAAFADAMELFVNESVNKREMGINARQHVIDHFSFEKFSNDLHSYVEKLN